MADKKKKAKKFEISIYIAAMLVVLIVGVLLVIFVAETDGEKLLVLIFGIFIVMLISGMQDNKLERSGKNGHMPDWCEGYFCYLEANKKLKKPKRKARKKKSNPTKGDL